jgi:hypothetical protein
LGGGKSWKKPGFSVFAANLGCAWWQKPGFYEYIGWAAVNLGRNPVSQSF